MYKYLGILIGSLFILSLGQIGIAYSIPQTGYIGPTLQGTEMKPLSSNQEVCIFIMIPPKNMSLLYFIAQKVHNGQIHPLSKSQEISMFGNVEKEKEVVSFLKKEGFNITFSSPFSVTAIGRTYLINQAFETSLFTYYYNGEEYYKPSTMPVIPKQLRGTLVSLTNFTDFSPQYISIPQTGGVLSPSQIPGTQFSAVMYTPQELQGAYNVTGPEGKNVTVVILDAYGDPEIRQDVAAFDRMFNLPPVNLTITPVGPYHPLLGLFTGWYEEVALDVEAVHSMAPYAKIDLVVASNAGPALYQAIDYIVSEDLGQVVDMSFGLPENLITATGFYYYYQGQPQINYPWVDYYFALGASEGISFFAASGDEGAYGGTPTYYGGVSFPSTSPFVTSVGGTSLFVNITSGELGMPGSNATYGYETAWSVEPQYEEPSVSTISSDGGYSTLFPAPWYQIPVIHSKVRATPDVSADANPYTGMEIVVTGEKTVIGGTSLAAQLWGGFAADVISYVGHPIGLFNPYLYEIYNNKTLYKMAFHPVTIGFNGEYEANSSYNLVTGIGSPNVGELEVIMKQLVNQPSLKISISTFQSGTKYPWYQYSTNFTVVASISLPNSSIVTSGTFNAYVYTTQGFLMSIPLHFNGSYWFGEIHVSKGDPPNVWSVMVNGTIDGVKGVGFTDVDVGDGINVLTPETNNIGISSPFTYQVCIYQPNGSPVEVNSSTSHFIQNGKDIFNVTLLPTSTPGLYQGEGEVIPPNPEGVYIVITNSSEFNVYSWEVVGGFIYGLVLMPVNDGAGSINPGENFTVLATSYDKLGLGFFTGNSTVYIYNMQGKLVYSKEMVPAPAVTQFFLYNLLSYDEANITLPSNFTQGFYKLIVSSKINTSVGMCLQNFTTGFYVGSSQGEGQAKVASEVYQGQNVTVYADITYSNGTPITDGEFVATLIPEQSIYDSINQEFNYGVPMQYNSTIHEWEAKIQVPSIYSREGLYSASGPAIVEISGTSALGNNVVINSSTFVMPYTFMKGNVTSPEEFTSIYSPSLSVDNASAKVSSSVLNKIVVNHGTLVISSSQVRCVEAIDSNVTIEGSNVGDSYTAFLLRNSNLTLVNVDLHNVHYAFNISNSTVNEIGVSSYNITSISTLPTPTVTSISPINVTTNSTTITVKVSGENLKVVQLTVNGENVTHFTVQRSSSGLTLQIPFSNLPGGLYSYQLKVFDGLPYTLSFNVYNSYPQVEEAVLTHSLSQAKSSIISLSTYLDIAYIIAVIGVILGLISLFMSRRVRK